MTRRTDAPLKELMAAIGAIAGRAATAEDRRRFDRYLELFIQWNRTHRMTALESGGAIVRDLFLDSLLFLVLLPPGPLAVVDIGAGAGIPGLPMKLVEPRIALTLIESKRKRVSFLLTACRELGLRDVVVEEGRAEALVEDDAGLAGTFDVAVSRAVGPVDQLFPVARKYLKVGGIFIAAGSPSSSVGRPFEAVRIAVPASRRHRVLLKALKES